MSDGGTVSVILANYNRQLPLVMDYHELQGDWCMCTS